MSGHSKWHSIKHKKAATDAKRGKLFTKLIKEITIAARGGSDLSGNPRLRTAVATAKANSMPNDNIERAIKKGSGELDGSTIDEYTYEGYGPGGTALIIAVATDNRNRTTAEVRHILSKNGGNLGENGCVAWMFDKKGLLVFDKTDEVDEDKLMEIGLEADGFEDIQEEEDQLLVYTEYSKLYVVKDVFDEAGIEAKEAKIDMVPQNTNKVEGKKVEQIMRLLDMLEDNDDVVEVYSNSDISDEELERLAGN